MQTNTFFICPNCGNDKEFKIFMSNFRVIKQSMEPEMRVEESDVLPNLRKNDNYVECKLCLHRLEYDNAVVIGKKYAQTMQLLQGRKHNVLKQNL